MDFSLARFLLLILDLANAIHHKRTAKSNPNKKIVFYAACY